jgi:hypothetical protein
MTAWIAVIRETTATAGGRSCSDDVTRRRRRPARRRKRCTHMLEKWSARTRAFSQPPCVGLLGGRGEPHNAVRMGHVGDDAKGAGDVALVVLGVKEAPEDGALKRSRNGATRARPRLDAVAQPAEQVRAPHLLKARHAVDCAQGDRAVVAV